MRMALICWLLMTSSAFAQPSLDKLKDFRIDGLIRFRTAEQAEETREKLIRAIWPDGLPRTLPKVSDVPKTAPELAALNGSLIGSAQQFDVDVSGYDWHALVYVVTPASAPNATRKLAIVHAGHMPEGPANYLSSGLSDTANHLLSAGYVVALIQMPLVAWNRDADGRIDGQLFTMAKRGTAGHNELFSKVEPTLKAGTMRFFLEPIVQSINQLVKDGPRPEQLLMIGLSGGGWTTHVYAAVDPRVDVSLPVAGAYPLYARPFSRGSAGDAEQEYAPIFSEKDSDQDGVLDTATGIASWLEVFALGAISPDATRPRVQVQVLNLYDSCCFHGEVYQSYAQPLTDMVEPLQRGKWSVFVDQSHRSHLISDLVLKEVVSKFTTP